MKRFIRRGGKVEDSSCIDRWHYSTPKHLEQAKESNNNSMQTTCFLSPVSSLIFISSKSSFSFGFFFIFCVANVFHCARCVLAVREDERRTPDTGLARALPAMVLQARALAKEWCGRKANRECTKEIISRKEQNMINSVSHQSLGNECSS